jgi:anti-sigma factor RsiW
MNCNQVREHLLDVEAGRTPPAVAEHLRACSACAAELASLRQTMSLLDDWRVPEPSPYFDTRFRARLREKPAAPVGWFAALRKPVLALAAMLVLAATVMIHGGRQVRRPLQVAANTEVKVVAQPGTAVGDLQYLDRNHDLLANFELLDELGSGDSNQINP